jgi:hypothetical protein
MAGGATAAARKQHLTARCVPDLDRHTSRIEAGTDVGDDSIELERLQVEGGHLPTPDAGRDHPAQIVV